MRLFARVVLAAVASTCLSSLAEAKVRIAVDLDRQTMHVETDDGQVFDWKVSSGKFGYETPAGKYGVLWMDKDHHSDEYDQAPMPDAIFFRPGYAIHGAYKSDFGHPASHGCIRLPVAKAAVLFDLVQAQGAQVTITGGPDPETIAAHAAPQGGVPQDKAAGYATAGYDAPQDAAGAYGAPDAPQSMPAVAQQPNRSTGVPALDSLFSGLY